MNRHLTTLALLAAALCAPLPAQASLNEEYGRSLALYRAAHYGEARSAFEALLARHPTGDYADNARYWIGETFYAEGDYASALAAFREVVAHHPLEPKAPDALFKIALCNLQLGRDDGYRNTLRGLGARYPDAAVSDRAARLLEQVDEGASQTAVAPMEQPTLFPAQERVTTTAPATTTEQQLFVDDDGMAVTLAARPSAEELAEIRRHLEEEREGLEQAAKDELSVGEILFSVVAPGGLLYMVHRRDERLRAEEALATIDQDFALVESERRQLSNREPVIAKAR